MTNRRINMLGMPWVEWRNLSGLADPYTALSAEQGVPSSGMLAEGKSTARSYMPEPSKQTDKQKRLSLVVQRARKMAGKKNSDVLARYAQVAGAKKASEVNSCKEALADAIGAHYDELFSEFINAGGDSIEEFHGCLDEAFDSMEEDIVEEISEDLLWEEFLTMKGLTLDAFHQLMDTVFVTEDEDEMASLLALQDLFEAEKKKGLIGGGETKSGGVSMRGFKRIAGSSAVGGSGGTIDWGKFGGKKKFKSVAGPENSSVNHSDAVAVGEEIFWEDFLAERGVTVGQFHQLMDETVASGDADDMEMLLNLEGVFKKWMAKRAAKSDAEQQDQQAQLKRTAASVKGASERNRRAANVRGEYLPIAKTGR